VGKINFSNPATLSSSGGIFAGAGADFCRIWKKCQIPAGPGARAEIQYSPTQQFAVPLSFTDLSAVKY